MQFRIRWVQMGSSKYSVDFHDGKQTHRDGSPFWGIALFSNKRKLAAFVAELRRKGYVEA